MRFKLLLITMLLIPCIAKGQEPVVFYSEGKMYVGEGIATDGTTSPSNTSLYVVGSMTFASKTAHQDSLTTVMQAGRTSLTGDLINALDPVHGTNHLFVSGGNGEIAFVNEILNGNPMMFTSATASGSQLADPEIEWSVYNTQRIKSAYDFATQAGLAKINEQKRKNYLDINKIVVPSKVSTSLDTRQGGYLVIDPSASVQVANLDISNAAFFEIGTASTAADAVPNKYLHTGYVKFKNALAYPSYTSGEAYRANYVHRVKLFDASDSNVHPEGGYYLTGFTPLFKGLMADYMFFNTLTEPGNGSVTSWKGTITDPTYPMIGGTGYFMAMTDFDADYQEIADNHFDGDKNEAENRTKNEYVFNRTLMVKDGSAQQKFNKKSTFDETFHPTEEIFNTASITVQLKAGYNFLGNPFTAPLDLSDIVNVTTGTAPLSDFGITVSAETSSNIEGIRNKYWVINKSTVMIDPSNANGYQYTLTFDDAQAVGGTAAGLHGNKQNEFYVAPMQMFVVQGGTQCSDQSSGKPACSFTIPYSKTLLDASSVTPRSASAGGERKDEFVLEAVDLDSNLDDRLAVVLREEANMMDVDATDTHKAVKVKENETSRVFPTMENVIYTRSSNDRPMLTNTIPTSTKQLAMYITSPTDKARNMVIRPRRLETMSTVSRVWLEDKFENKVVELTPETEYFFTSPVLTEEEASKNRFVLHFSPVEDTDNDLIVNEDPISCYYNSSILYIRGLNEKDLNSSVLIYDLQGRIVGKTKINVTGIMTYPKPLPHGTYIVKITGKRNHTTKFINTSKAVLD